MLLSHHRSHTEYALNNIEIDPEKKKEIIKGAFANDLCEFTNEGEIFIPSKDVIHSLFESKPKVFGSIAIYQSHFGNLASMHAMAKANNESPGNTRGEITAWFDFLNNLTLGIISIDPDAMIGEDNTAISGMFSDHSIEYDQIFDSENLAQIRSRSIGMMCHLIQDLFTQSHCGRNSHNEIVMFYCYQAQNKQKHKEGDHAIIGLEQELTNQCRKCVESIMNNHAYDYSQVMVLSNSVQNSGGGAFS
jgi:hypothetical protein